MYWIIGFMPNSLVAVAGSACIHVLGDVMEDVGLIIFYSEHLSDFCSTWMSCKVVVVA